MKSSILVKNQKKQFGPKRLSDGSTITAVVRFDDECNNGYNSFSITGEIREYNRIEQCGCIREEIAIAFPELTPFIKWHLSSTVEPHMYYLANTLYHIRCGRLDFARTSAVWPEATDEELLSADIKEKLVTRLAGLMDEFYEAIVSLGFTY